MSIDRHKRRKGPSAARRLAACAGRDLSAAGRRGGTLPGAHALLLLLMFYSCLIVFMCYVFLLLIYLTTLPYPTLPYPTLPYLTLPYPTLPYLPKHPGRDAPPGVQRGRIRMYVYIYIYIYIRTYIYIYIHIYTYK